MIMKNIVYFFAGMALLGSGITFAATEGNLQGQDQNGLTMQQLVAKCTHLQSFEQIKNIDAQITCSAERLVWVNRGIKDPSQLNVPKTGVEFCAHIKGKYQSQQFAVDLSDILANIPLLLQKWRFNVIQTITIKSCSELQAIADNPNYCAQQFSQLKDQTLQQMVQQKTRLEQTTLESDNMMGEMVQEILTSPAKAVAAHF
jgi:hypothetical protein